MNLKKSNSALSELNQNERLQIITAYKIKRESFNHFIEIQGEGQTVKFNSSP